MNLQNTFTIFQPMILEYIKKLASIFSKFFNLNVSIVYVQFVQLSMFLLTLLTVLLTFKVFNCFYSYFFPNKSKYSRYYLDTGVTGKEKSDLKFTYLNSLYHSRIKSLEKFINSSKNKRPIQKAKHNMFVIDFQGDDEASELNKLGPMIDTVLENYAKGDKVVIRLESYGGYVSSYGLAAAKLKRLRDAKGLELIICVDQCAASGGYMMAAVANTIFCSNFASIGSIGVVQEFLNYGRILNDIGINQECITAGNEKRLLTSYGDNTDEKRAIVKKELNDIHTAMKAWILDHRASISDIDEVSTGKTWIGTNALKLGLVDKIVTSDEFLYDSVASGMFNVYLIENKHKNEHASGCDNIAASIINIIQENVDKQSAKKHINSFVKNIKYLVAEITNPKGFRAQ